MVCERRGRKKGRDSKGVEAKILGDLMHVERRKEEKTRGGKEKGGICPLVPHLSRDLHGSMKRKRRRRRQRQRKRKTRLTKKTKMMMQT